MARGDLTDEERSLIEPRLPLSERGPIPDLRQQFNAVMRRFRTGSPWRDPPAAYGPRSTVYDRFRLWATAGVFEQSTQATIAEAAARGQADQAANRKRRGSHSGHPVSHDPDLYQQRDTAERCIKLPAVGLDQWRGAPMCRRCPGPTPHMEVFVSRRNARRSCPASSGGEPPDAWPFTL
ncbi:transposase [Streptosporangium canum]|uniref:transposase n=1 Tax=Streptosporangium canum TaxID=324952 RepID=UPI0033B31A16